MTTRVLIAGGGVGGLEAALALKVLAGDRVDVAMLAPQRHFTYRPLAVNEPFDRGSTLRVELAAVAEDRGFSLIRDAVESVDTAAREVCTQDGRRVGYDELVLALGAWPVAAVRGAFTFRGPRDTARLAAELEALEGRPRIAFVVPEGAVWTLPLYELALLTAERFAARGIAAKLVLRTPEAAPLAVFGIAAAERVGALLADRGIALRLDAAPAADHLADLTIAIPVLQGPAVRGLPCDRGGFTEVDAYARVVDAGCVHAVGDMTHHPVKQGGLAAQQADVAAADIAAAASAPVAPVPYQPVLRGMLLTGGAPLYLRNPPATGGSGAEAPWWPAHKIFGTHLAPYLATHAGLMVPVHA